MNRIVNHITRCLFAIMAGIAFCSHGGVVVSMVGDDDGFGGSQGADSNPGDVFSIFLTPSIAPGTYTDLDAMDVTTTEPWTTYTFIFNIPWEAVPPRTFCRNLLNSGHSSFQLR